MAKLSERAFLCVERQTLGNKLLRSDATERAQTVATLDARRVFQTALLECSSSADRLKVPYKKRNSRGDGQEGGWIKNLTEDALESWDDLAQMESAGSRGRRTPTF